MKIEILPMDRDVFQLMHDTSHMASDKLTEGIAGFSSALINLEFLLSERLAALEVAA
jgi:transaldolase